METVGQPRRRCLESISGGSLLLCAAALLLAGCTDSPLPQPRPAGSPVDLSTAGTIRVEVEYHGPVPTPRALDMRSAPPCAAAHVDLVYDQPVRVNDGRLENAVVWISAGLGAHAFPVPETPVIIDQKGCIYDPHVAAVMVGQPVEFWNSDPEPHNVHGHPTVVEPWNFMMPRKGLTRRMTFSREEVAIAVGCDVHPWMRAYLAVIAHPYFGVTPAGGAVTLERVPPGEYMVAAWHEQLGTREQSVRLEPRGTAAVGLLY